MLTPEDELDTLDQDLGAARRKLHSLETAPMEGRWTRNQTQWMDAIANQRDRIRVLEREREAMIADLIAEAEGHQ
jgi:hypothetical protein